MNCERFMEEKENLNNIVLRHQLARSHFMQISGTTRVNGNDKSTPFCLSVWLFCYFMYTGLALYRNPIKGRLVK